MVDDDAIAFWKPIFTDFARQLRAGHMPVWSHHTPVLNPHFTVNSVTINAGMGGVAAHDGRRMGMPITIDLRDDLLERLERQAQACSLSLQEWVTRVLSRAPEFPDSPEAWRQLNARRFQLIHQRHHCGLSAAEEAELNELQATTDRWLEPPNRQRLAFLEPLEEFAQRLGRSSNE